MQQATHIPKSGSATYTTAVPGPLPALSQSGAKGWIVGGFIPFLHIAELNAASVAINVDFFARSVTTSITFGFSPFDFSGQQIITSPIVLTGKGVLNNNGSYTLALTGPLPELPPSVRTLVGTASGRLCGPSPHETAETVSRRGYITDWASRPSFFWRNALG